MLMAPPIFTSDRLLPALAKTGCARSPTRASLSFYVSMALSKPSSTRPGSPATLRDRIEETFNEDKPRLARTGHFWRSACDVGRASTKLADNRNCGHTFRKTRIAERVSDRRDRAQSLRRDGLPTRRAGLFMGVALDGDV